MKKIITLILPIILTLSLTGCVKPYDTPEFVTIEASQTAFLIPLTGNTENQGVFASEELLEEAKVATKEIQIPHYWVQTGRMSWAGEWRDSVSVIIVERTPVTREWTATKSTGSSTADQAIYSESSESIGFSVGMNCSAQIDEQNATLFLYRYNNKSLEEIMDTEIRAMVEAEFNKECSTYLIADIITHKQTIMDAVVDTVSNFFAERGITITVLGLKEGISYEDGAIQDAINEKFSSEQLLVTQQNINAVTISKAEAEAQSLIIEAEARAAANQLESQGLSSMLIEDRKIEKWDGVLPQVSGVDSIITMN